MSVSMVPKRRESNYEKEFQEKKWTFTKKLFCRNADKNVRNQKVTDRIFEFASEFNKETSKLKIRNVFLVHSDIHLSVIVA